MSVETIRRHHRFEPEAYHELIDQQSAHDTIFVAISPAEAASVLAVYGARFISRADSCTAEHLAAVRNLTRKIQNVLDENNERNSTTQGADEEQEYFVRLSSRSPKDGIPLRADQLRQALLQLMRTHGIAGPRFETVAVVSQPSKHVSNPEVASKDDTAPSTSPSSHPPNSLAPIEDTKDDERSLITAVEYDELLTRITEGHIQLHAANEFACAAFALMHQFMKVCTAEEVMALLTSSERVAIDLSRALDAYEVDPSSWRQHICLRAWEERIQDRLEFRCFVHENRLTAISQYNTYVCVEELSNAAFRTDAYGAIINTWGASFKDALRDIGDYVCDLAYCPSEKEVLLIELNPPEPSTGSGLFDWQRDADVLNRGADALPERRIQSADITIGGEASSALYVEEVQEGVVCRCRTHVLPPQQLCALIHTFVGETLRELYSPRDRWHYSFALTSLSERLTQEPAHEFDPMRACSQRIAQLPCAIL